MAAFDLILTQEITGGGAYEEARLLNVAPGQYFTFDTNKKPVVKVIETSEISGLDTALNTRINVDQLGVANGVATLNNDGKITSAQLPASIVGAVQYQGVWNADTNTPVIPAAAAGNQGHYYKVSTPGNTEVDGEDDWSTGDWIISDGTVWSKVDNSELVTSVCGRIGAITITKTDVALENVTNDAQLKIASNLADLASAETARTNLGLGNVATLNIGVVAGTVTAGDDARLPVLGEKAALSGTAGTPSATNKFVTNEDTRLVDLRGIAFVTAPAAANSTGVAGQVAYDSNYFYQCVAENTWKRHALATWA